MKQVYYTSTERGLRGTRGFQVQAATPGIPAPVLEFVERLGVYAPPPGAPSRPTPEEIEQFPISLRYHRLPDGTQLIAQARYVGTDYSGRYGNYFTHTLVGQCDRLPIELWGSPLWRRTESDGPELPELQELPVQPMQPVEVEPAFYTAVELALRQSRRVIVVDSCDRVAARIAAVCRALPRSLARELTFTTYTRNPYHEDALVTGILQDSDFRFSPQEVEHVYSVLGSSPLPDTAFGRWAASTPEFPAFAEGLAAAELSPAMRFLKRDFEEVDATLFWCAGRLSRLSGVAAFLEEALPAGASMEAVHHLYTSSRNDGALRGVLLPWLLRRPPELLEWGAQLGFLDHPGEALREVGRQLNPADHLAQLEKMHRYAGGVSILEGVAQSLMARVAEGFPEVKPLVEVPEICQIMLAFAREQRATLLAFRLLGMSAMPRADAWKQALELAESPSHLSLAYQCIWTTPSLEEIALIEQADLSDTPIPGWLRQARLKHGDPGAIAQASMEELKAELPHWGPLPIAHVLERDWAPLENELKQVLQSWDSHQRKQLESRLKGPTLKRYRERLVPASWVQRLLGGR